MLVVSYADVKRCLQSSWAELRARAAGGALQVCVCAGAGYNVGMCLCPWLVLVLRPLALASTHLRRLPFLLRAALRPLPGPASAPAGLSCSCAAVASCRSVCARAALRCAAHPPPPSHPPCCSGADPSLTSGKAARAAPAARGAIIDAFRACKHLPRSCAKVRSAAQHGWRTGCALRPHWRGDVSHGVARDAYSLAL